MRRPSAVPRPAPCAGRSMPRAGTGRSTRREFRPDTEIPGTGRRRRARAVRGQAGRWPLVFPREGGGPERLDPSYANLDPRLRGGTGAGRTEGHTSELQSLKRMSLGARCFNKNRRTDDRTPVTNAHLVCRLLLEEKKHI